MSARWRYSGFPSSCDAAFAGVRAALVDSFAAHESRSVQHTLYAMGEAALAACPEVTEIDLTMPNRHHLLVDLAPFGLENPNEIFVAHDGAARADPRDDRPQVSAQWSGVRGSEKNSLITERLPTDHSYFLPSIILRNDRPLNSSSVSPVRAVASSSVSAPALMPRRK